MSPPPPDKPTGERIGPWVRGLPRTLTNIVIREGGNEVPSGEVPLGDERDAVVACVAELLDGITESAAKTLSFVLVATDGQGVPRARMPMRLRPASEGGGTDSHANEYRADPNEVVRMSLEHNDKVMELWIQGQKLLLDTARSTIQDLTKALSSERAGRERADERAREATTLATDAVTAATDKSDDLLDGIKEGVAEAIVEGLKRKVFGPDAPAVAPTVTGPVVPDPGKDAVE